MTLVNILGEKGSGKTLLATLLATKESERPIYSNYTLRLENYHALNPEDLFNLDIPMLVILDEIYAWVESRTSGKPINRYLSYIVFQSRKMNRDFILTEQEYMTFETRLRSQTDVDVYCKKVDLGFLYVFYKNSGFIRYKPKKCLLTFEEAEKIYPIYDTEEIVKPLEMDELLFKISSSKEDISIEIDRIVDEIFEKEDINPKKISKAIVKRICLRENLPRFYEDLIYGEIKYRDLKEESQ